VPTLFVLSSVFTALFFFMAFKEKISISMVIGILIMLVCVAMISMSSVSGPPDTEMTQLSMSIFQEEELSDQSLYAIISIVCATFVSIVFSIQNVIMRKFKDSYPNYFLTQDSVLIEYFYETIIIAVFLAYSGLESIKKE
jgi:drug/metabolite transporter (DMT)-like permease